MDVFVLPSHREGFSRSGMEAAATGLPIITTDVRGCRQVVRDGETGLLVPVRDPDLLRAAVISLANDADRRATMGQAARALAEKEFDQRRQVDITLQTYARLGVPPGVRP
jgi:glycosyltransferase involved in cell wall biosynthesis